MRRTLLRAGLVLALALGCALPVAARECFRPGQIIDVSMQRLAMQGLVDRNDLNLSIDFDGISIPVKPLSVSSSRLRVRLPMRGLPGDALFWLRHVPSGGGRDIILANGRSCAGSPANPSGPEALSRRSRRPLERATANDVAAPSGAPEYLLAGRAAAMGQAEALLVESGAEVLRRKDLGGLGIRMMAVDLRGTMTLNQLRGALARRGVAAKADKHTVYRAAAGGAVSYAPGLIGLDPARTCKLGRQVRIGLIDGPVDAAVPALAGVPLRATSVLGTGDHQGSPDHATGIAALIASPGSGAVPAGVAPGAQIFSVVAFARTGGREVARLENIAEALDWLIESRVELINMSLSGPQNDTLAEIIRLADARGIVMLAAAGNGGREGVAYPASDPRVIGITAVDAARRLYRKANFGDGVDFAAPGVDMIVPSARGTAHRSGTSYASGIATAVVAQMMSRGVSGREAVIAGLRGAAEDLGAPGRDPQFGWGLIRVPNGC
ncbi:S8 family serine peptidase [Gemmobacter serpentinus]|uniref:S8 family serine peptidase n=1 Tax=Gemmobacter serpentinus TaxID=2652247 RepID=UPI0018658269|nr:S8 family serine peptidase [Gemmobacter serpentinus]